MESVPPYSAKIEKIFNFRDVVRLFERYSSLEAPPELTLDCRFLSSNGFNSILKFVEEYMGDITMVAYEPVLSTVLSRFTEIKKDFKIPESGSILEFKFRTVSGLLRNKLFAFFDLESEDEEKEDIDVGI